MAIRWRHRLTPLGAAVALVATAGIVAAAGASLTTRTAIGGAQQAITAPCTNMSVTYEPAYSASDGAYTIASVTWSGTCPAGEYGVVVAIATGGSSYVERGGTLTLASAGSTSITLTLPTKVKTSEMTNLAVLVEKLG